MVFQCIVKRLVIPTLTLAVVIRTYKIKFKQ